MAAWAAKRSSTGESRTSACASFAAAVNRERLAWHPFNIPPCRPQAGALDLSKPRRLLVGEREVRLGCDFKPFTLWVPGEDRAMEMLARGNVRILYADSTSVRALCQRRSLRRVTFTRRTGWECSCPASVCWQVVRSATRLAAFVVDRRVVWADLGTRASSLAGLSPLSARSARTCATWSVRSTRSLFRPTGEGGGSLESRRGQDCTSRGPWKEDSWPPRGGCPREPSLRLRAVPPTVRGRGL